MNLKLILVEWEFKTMEYYLEQIKKTLNRERIVDIEINDGEFIITTEDKIITVTATFSGVVVNLDVREFVE